MNAKVPTWFFGCCLVFAFSGSACVEEKPQGGPDGGTKATPPPVRFQGMVKIPAGEFMMGCSSGDETCLDDEKPAHKVWLSEYWIDKTEVTVAAYKKCVEAEKCAPAHFEEGACYVLTGQKWEEGNLPKSCQGDDQPVVCVDWNQAKEYCDWAGGRLPTEAEWEKAARGGTGGATYGNLDEVAWYQKNSGGSTHPVGQKKPNAFGLFDMLGNVIEWCADWYGADYYQGSPKRDPGGPGDGDRRVIRGGSWFAAAIVERASLRSWFDPDVRIHYLGFRCAVSADIKK